MGEMETTVPKLPIYSIPQLQSPLQTGMLTPPLYTTIASVPFKWEEIPGKPLTNTTNNNMTIRCLGLPPRLLSDALMTKMSSPTTVLEGPYLGKASSLREFYGSFDDDDEGQFGELVFNNRGHKCLFGRCWGRRVLKGKRDVGEDSFVFSSFLDIEDTSTRTGMKMTRLRRNNILATIYESLKQTIPWGRK